MSASIKYWNRDRDTDARVKNAIQYIKSAFNKQTKNAKVINIDLMVCGHGAHPFGSASQPGDYIDFMVGIGQERIKEFGEHDLKEFYSKLQNELAKLHISFKWNTIWPYVGGRDCKLDVINEVYQLDCIPKEFDTLNKLLTKYTNKSLNPYEWYVVRLFGKRGKYDESGDKTFRCYDNSRCQRAIDVIRKYCTSKYDILTWSLVKYDDIDTDYSIHYETECYGYRDIKLHIIVKTPTGRNKCDMMF